MGDAWRRANDDILMIDIPNIKKNRMDDLKSLSMRFELIP